MKNSPIKIYLNILLFLTIYIEARNKFKLSPIDLDIYNNFNLTLLQTGILTFYIAVLFSFFKIDDIYFLMFILIVIPSIYFINFKFVDFNRLKKLTKYLIIKRDIDLNGYITFSTVVLVMLLIFIVIVAFIFT